GRYGVAMPLLYLAAGSEARTNRFEVEAGLEKGGYVRYAGGSVARESVSGAIARRPGVHLVLALRFDRQHLGKPGVDGRSHALPPVAAQPRDAHPSGCGAGADAGCGGHLEEAPAARLGGQRGSDRLCDRDVVVDRAQQHRVTLGGVPGDGGGEDVGEQHRVQYRSGLPNIARMPYQAGGCRRCQCSRRSSWAPSASSTRSPPGRPISCTPIGRPSSVVATGSVSAGSPATFTKLVNGV